MDRLLSTPAGRAGESEGRRHPSREGDGDDDRDAGNGTFLGLAYAGTPYRLKGQEELITVKTGAWRGNHTSAAVGGLSPAPCSPLVAVFLPCSSRTGDERLFFLLLLLFDLRLEELDRDREREDIGVKTDKFG